jgi:hypothetical protein
MMTAKWPSPLRRVFLRLDPAAWVASLVSFAVFSQTTTSTHYHSAPPHFSALLDMSASTSMTRRAVLALPMVAIAFICFQAMDLGKMIAHQQPFLQAGEIKWHGGSIPILSSFHYVQFLDELWRGTTASFSPSTLGYDVASWWQMFSFVNDLGPLYAVWILESSRVGNRWSPAYL